MKTTPLFLLTLCLALPALGQNPPPPADAPRAPRAAAPGDREACIRLDGEMEKLAQKNAWSGVERAYSGSVSPHGESTPGYAELGCSKPQSLFLAAQAARQVGNIRETLRRLMLANTSCKEKAKAGAPCADDILAALSQEAAAILCANGPADPAWTVSETVRKAVAKTAKKTDEAPPPLIVRPAGAFFEPDKTQALEFADAKLRESGSFSGYLPVGEYLVAGERKLITADKAKLLQVWGVSCAN